MELNKVINNIPGIFTLQNVEPLPMPIGVDIESNGDIAYLDASLDKWSMYCDRLNLFNYIKSSIEEIKNEQTSKAN